MKDFSIDCTWVSALHESPEVRETSAMLKIGLGNTVVTRNEDEWSRTVRDEVRLSAYPMALWFASSWWRLRWESLTKSVPIHSWRMSHELAAAGYGYLWPRLLFASDGENVQAWACQSAPDSKEAVRYLSGAYQAIPGSAFEHTIDQFIMNVIARLDAVEIGRTVLHDLWDELTQERNDDDLAAYRRLEAMLGFDPDECPNDLYRRFADLIPKAGASAVAELAPVCASDDPAATLERIITFAESEGLEGRIDFSIPAGNFVSTVTMPVWQRGWDLAGQARAALGLNGAAVSDERLCDLVNLPMDRVLNAEYTSPSRPPLGIAIRHDESKQIKFLFRKRNKPGRRFELARLLCDSLIADKNDGWLPVTDAKTARQKIQRAFAAEFLCPIESLKKFLAGDFSNDATEEAAEHFGVSQKAVETHLVNSGLLSPEILGDYDSHFEFTYDINPKIIPAPGAFEARR